MSFDWKQPYTGVAWQKYTKVHNTYKDDKKGIHKGALQKPNKSKPNPYTKGYEQIGNSSSNNSSDHQKSFWPDWAEATEAAATKQPYHRTTGGADDRIRVENQRHRENGRSVGKSFIKEKIKKENKRDGPDGRLKPTAGI